MEDKDQVGVGQLAAMTLHEFTRRPPIASFSGGLNRVKMLTIKIVVPHLVFTRVEHLSGDAMAWLKLSGDGFAMTKSARIDMPNEKYPALDNKAAR